MNDLTPVTIIHAHTEDKLEVSLSRVPVRDETILYNGVPITVETVILLSGGGAICYTETTYNLDKL